MAILKKRGKEMNAKKKSLVGWTTPYIWGSSHWSLGITPTLKALKKNKWNYDENKKKYLPIIKVRITLEEIK